VGRGREVNLEGEKRPGEERPHGGVNNAVVGERIRTTNAGSAARRGEREAAQILGAAAPQGEKRQGGRHGPRGSRGDGRGETSEGRVPMDDPA